MINFLKKRLFTKNAKTGESHVHTERGSEKTKLN